MVFSYVDIRFAQACNDLLLNGSHVGAIFYIYKQLSKLGSITAQ